MMAIKETTVLCLGIVICLCLDSSDGWSGLVPFRLKDKTINVAIKQIHIGMVFSPCDLHCAILQLFTLLVVHIGLTTVDFTH